MDRRRRRTPLGGPDPGPSKLDGVLDSVMAGLGGPTVATIVLVHERWAEVVGPEVADRSAPISIEDGTLRIGASGAGWASHIRWAEREIIGRLDVLLGPGLVTAVSVRISRGETL